MDVLQLFQGREDVKELFQLILNHRLLNQCNVKNCIHIMELGLLFLKFHLKNFRKISPLPLPLIHNSLYLDHRLNLLVVFLLF